jgi:hypothetical protein
METVTGKYVNGKEKVANPVYTQLVNDIEQQERALGYAQRTVDKYTGKSQYQPKMKIANDGYDSALAYANNQVVGTPEYDQAQITVEKFKKDVANEESKKRGIQKKLKNGYSERTQVQTKLTSLRHQLEATPVMINQDTFATHSYQVTHNTQLVKAALIAINANGQQKKVMATASYTNRSHAAQRLLRLPAVLKKQLSRADLITLLYQAAQEEGESIVADHIEIYRAEILIQAEQSQDINRQVELWVGYSLAGQSGKIATDISANINRFLTQKYGQAVYFDADKLLFL